VVYQANGGYYEIVSYDPATDFLILTNLGYAGNLDPGATVNAGVVSPAGVCGTQGPTGPTGNDGLTITGPTGPTGADSTVTGPTGPTGNDGLTITGPTGPTGGGMVSSAGVTGDLFYATNQTATAVSRLADVAVKQVLISGGVNAAPSWSASPTISGNLTVEGETTLGNATTDDIHLIGYIDGDIIFKDGATRYLKMAVGAGNGYHLGIYGMPGAASYAGGNLALESGWKGAGGASDGTLSLNTAISVGPIVIGNSYTASITFPGITTGNATAAHFSGANNQLVKYSSDERLKNDIKSIDGTFAFNIIKEICPKSFRWKQRAREGTFNGNREISLQVVPGDVGKKNFGFIAQEVSNILPDAVFYNTIDDLYSIDFNQILSVSVAAIKELMDQVEKQTTTIEMLTERLNTLEALIIK
jgi:hypothetical protein